MIHLCQSPYCLKYKPVKKDCLRPHLKFSCLLNRSPEGLSNLDWFFNGGHYIKLFCEINLNSLPPTRRSKVGFYSVIDPWSKINQVLLRRRLSWLSVQHYNSMVFTRDAYKDCMKAWPHCAVSYLGWDGDSKHRMPLSKLDKCHTTSILHKFVAANN